VAKAADAHVVAAASKAEPVVLAGVPADVAAEWASKPLFPSSFSVEKRGAQPLFSAW